MYNVQSMPFADLDVYQTSLATEQGQPGAVDASRLSAGTYKIDPAHTLVAWTVNHMGFSLLEGIFGASDGQIVIDPNHPTESLVEVSFAIKDLSVTTCAFANHLRSADLFDAENFPVARFVSTSVKPSGTDRATITGDLTIKGITRSVALDAAFVGVGQNPLSDKLNFGFAATTTILRSEFDLGFLVPAVSDKVKLRINAAFSAE
ncbi:YceI family protein [Ensifer adhaerens]|uniref:YceI family protein n=1 Tax=Ensifer adhaerens TaxID=106592 RepID=UPI001CC0382D|nr:YceI family protein [Ensifer adhaerens]MBZ7924824.1 YceI family protein [Ensifer adhaerens]UAX95956.1 YceI family protein [Ensifer adhaerens]UAY04702.1 YceI family protein [Ensifer adhaerens]UAY10133.1 YceI family protein [Ensifer adhaerens]